MRYAIIDYIRGLSVLGMMLFHMNYMLEAIFFRDVIPFADEFWYFFGPMIAITFIFVSGFSYYISSKGELTRKVIQKSITRSGILFLSAGAISLVTFTFIPEQRISWGIIHFFALATLFMILFTRFGKSNMLWGIFAIAIGNTLQPIRIDTQLLIPFAMANWEYFSADWYPLLPWFGYMLLGHSTAYWLTRKGLIHHLHTLDRYTLPPIEYVGRHALLLYMLHIPIFYFFLSSIFR